VGDDVDDVDVQPAARKTRTVAKQTGFMLVGTPATFYFENMADYPDAASLFKPIPVRPINHGRQATGVRIRAYTLP
jgi:hypothetical protein